MLSHADWLFRVMMHRAVWSTDLFLFGWLTMWTDPLGLVDDSKSWLPGLQSYLVGPARTWGGCLSTWGPVIQNLRTLQGPYRDPVR